ncbi:MAG TPA: hypothetical protein VHN99_00080 [Deinococcales bacterium]|nr:hypothetical protein [Deinococcales bacterium]
MGFTTLTEGVALDPAGGRVLAAAQDGVRAFAWPSGGTGGGSGNAGTLLIPALGVHDLLGLGSGSGLMLAWWHRDVLESDTVLAWYRGRSKVLWTGSVQNLALVALPSGPAVVVDGQDGLDTTLSVAPWSGRPVTVYRSRLAVRGLAAGRAGGKLRLLFAEGFTQTSDTGSDEKWDARLLDVPLAGGLPAGAGVVGGDLGPAVLPPEGGRYLVRPDGTPVWWGETPAAQARARASLVHEPQLLERPEGGVPHALTGPLEATGWLAGTLGTSIAWLDGTRLHLTGPGGDVTPVMTPNTAERAAVAIGAGGEERVVFQSPRPDGFTSDLLATDTLRPYRPTWLDRLSVSLGWNPYYPGQAAFAQLALSLLLGALAAVLSAPVTWLVSSARPLSVRAAVVAAVAVALLSRYLGGLAVSWPPLLGWVFTPFLDAPWLAVLAGLLAGAAVAPAVGRRAGGELAPVTAAAVTLFFAAFAVGFARAGFIHF